MSDFLYKFRKFKNRIKRKYMRPTGGQFDTMEYTPAFKIILTSIIALALMGVSLIVLLANGVFDKQETVSIDASAINNTDATVESTPEPSVEITPSPTPSPTPEPTLVPGPTPKIPGDAVSPLSLDGDEEVIEVGWIDGDLINVRTGASPEYSRMGVLPQDSIVEVLEKGRWLKIKFLNGAGYITNTYYVEGYYPLSDEQEAELAAQPSATPSTRVVEEEYVYENGTTTIHLDAVKEETQQFFVAEVWCEPGSLATYMVDTELDRTNRMTPTEMAEEVGAILAINGDFVSYHDKGVAIRNGEILRDSQDYEMLLLYDDGRMEGIDEDEMTAEEMVEAGVVECWSAGPVLVKNGAAYDDFTGRSNTNPPNPRTGIGMIEPGHYILIVADGRRLDYPGPTLVEFAHLFEQYGCEVAYNLYGGAVSTMVYNGVVMNEPSGINEKSSGDIIYIK